MRVYTYSEARQRLASLLDEARRDGSVYIQRRNGERFVLSAEPLEGSNKSPFEAIEPVPLPLSTEEIVEIIREGRERGYHTDR